MLGANAGPARRIKLGDFTLPRLSPAPISLAARLRKGWATFPTAIAPQHPAGRNSGRQRKTIRNPQQSRCCSSPDGRGGIGAVEQRSAEIAHMNIVVCESRFGRARGAN